MQRIDYPAQSYRRLYDPALGPLWTPPEGLSPAEDGAHPPGNPQFFEWWYFDAALESGHRLVIVFHAALFNITSRPPAVDIRLTAPGRESAVSVQGYPREACQTASDRCDLRIGDCRVQSIDDNTYTLTIRQEHIRADLTFERQLPGWKPGTGALFADDASGHFFKWVVPLPLARVQGSIRIGDKQLTADGIGYHDHNWGNCHLSDVFSRWYWGRFISKDRRSALIFGDVISNSESPVHVRPLLLVHDGEILPRQHFDIAYHEITRNPATGIQYPQRIHIFSHDASFPFDLTLSPQETLEALHFASPRFRHTKIRSLSEALFYLTFSKPLMGDVSRRAIGSTAYLRFHGRGQMQIGPPHQTKVPGEAIYEIMDFAP